MRRARLMMGIGVLVVLSAAACAAPHQDSVEGPGTTRTATSESLVGSEPTTNVADASASGGGSGMIDPVPANTTTTTSPTPAAPTSPEAPGPNVDSGEVDALLAELDSQLAGLDSLLNEAAAAMAAEEGEILP